MSNEGEENYDENYAILDRAESNKQAPTDEHNQDNHDAEDYKDNEQFEDHDDKGNDDNKDDMQTGEES